MGIEMTEKNIHDAVDYIYTQGQAYAKAKGELTYLEEFRKSKKALLMTTIMKDEKIKSVAAAEVRAYADVEYMELLKGIAAATEKAEGLRWGLVAAQARVDVWRSLEASNRQIDKAVL
jgi:hypothetical protein